MKISKKEVERIAALSRLKLKEKEEEKFSEELSLILDYIERLKKIDSKKTEPLYQTTGTKNLFRKDGVKTFAGKERIIQQAPRKKEGFIEINKVFE